MGPTHVENVADLACRTALAYRGVAHVSVPLDIQEKSVTRKGSKRNVPHHTRTWPRAAPVCRAADDLGRVAEVLNCGTKIAILATQGALRATDALEGMAERLAAPIVKALLGKAAVPDDSPYTTGTIGLLGTRPSQEALEECDTLDGRNVVSVSRVPAAARAGAGGADRTGPRARRASLPGRSGPRGRQRSDAAGTAAVAGSQE
jgi:pyruvate dehydrogenase (quinone)